MTRYLHQTGGEMVTVENVSELQRGTLVEIGALIGVVTSYDAGTAVMRVGGQVIGPVTSSKEAPAEQGAAVYVSKGELTTVGGKGARAAGVLLSGGNRARVLLRSIVA